MFDHGIEDRQQLVHAGHQRHFGPLARRSEPLIEGFDDGVPSRRHHGAHIERTTNDRTATPDDTPSYFAPADPPEPDSAIDLLLETLALAIPRKRSWQI